MIAAAATLLLALSAAQQVPLPPPPAGMKPDLRPLPPGAHSGETKCGACHSTDGWGDVAFAHERTGFPLRGGHRRATCKQCHPGTFSRAVSHECSACHRDPHRSQLGARCGGCHDEDSWRSRYDADAHRRTGFPLSGRHAFLTCEQCHGDKLDRGFARPVSTCFDCHRGNYQRTGQGQAGLDHAAAGIPTTCEECHSPWRFTGAFFPAHERCFQIATGPHAGIRCLGCHTQPFTSVVVNACSTNTAGCTRCHRDPETSARHTGVAGYAFQDRKCYECHRFARAAGLRGGIDARGTNPRGTRSPNP